MSILNKEIEANLEIKEIGKHNKGKSKKNKKGEEKNPFKFMNEIIGVKDIHDKYIETIDGYCVIVAISTPDIEIQNADEQTAIEDNLLAYMMSLNFPVKYRITTRKYKLSEFKDLLKANKNSDDNEFALDYSAKLENQITEIETSKETFIRQSYVCISSSNKSYKDDKSKLDKLVKELNLRYQTVVNGLRVAGIKTKIVRKLEAYQLYYDIFNKNSNLRISDTLENGSYDLYSQGIGVLYNPEESPQDKNENFEIEIKENEQTKDSDIFNNGTTNIKNMIKPDIFDVKDDFIKLGRNRYCRMYSFENLPRYLNMGYLNEIFSLGLVDITTYIENIPDAKVIDTITSKFSKVMAHVTLKKSRNEIPDYDKELAAADLDSLRKLIQTNSDRMFYVQNLITIWAENEEKLNDKCDLLEGMCDRKGIKARVLIKDQKEAFISALPLNRQLYKQNYRNITTGAGISFFPIGNTELCHKYGTYLGRNIITNSPICYDSFLGQRGLENSNELTNPMEFICGKAGSGKSTTMKVTIARKLRCGHWVIILDPEGEYSNLVKKFGGKYVTLKSGVKSGINPFELDVEEDPDTGKRYIDLYGKMAEIRALISSFVNSYGGRMLQPNELSGFERAFNKIFTDKQITRNPDSLYEDDPMGVGKIKKRLPILTDLKNALKEDKFTQELADLMTIITGDGSMAMFDCETDPKLIMEKGKRLLIGFNMKELDEFTQSYAMKNTLSWIWGKFANYKFKEIDKDVYVDEGWVFAKQKESEYLEHLSRRGRKYMIALHIATQMIEEFLQNASGKAIIQQCATKFIMRQDPSVARQVAEFFGLSNSAQTFINTFDKGQGLLITERDQILLHVDLFDFEKTFATT